MTAVLNFGQHKGKKLDDLPFPYLQFLTYWKPEVVDGRVVIQHSGMDLVSNLVGNSEFYLLNETSILPSGNPLKSRAWWAVLVSPSTSENERIEMVARNAIHIDEMQKANGFPRSARYVAHFWVWCNRRELVIQARDYVRENKLCLKCGTQLVPIADRRSNGVEHHTDWDTRMLHKQCFSLLLRMDQ
eukprot:c5837_g1_i1.p1 GENE.c5837_g1_i1~~c5837_g1_i1.p1  ORF type:complete len:197 (+),score=25.42 c5837_g1_i1:33-593(+)